MARIARPARSKFRKLLNFQAQPEPCQGEGRGFKSLFPLWFQEVKEQFRCISKMMRLPDALFGVCALPIEEKPMGQVARGFADCVSPLSGRAIEVTARGGCR